MLPRLNIAYPTTYPPRMIVKMYHPTLYSIIVSTLLALCLTEPALNLTYLPDSLLQNQPRQNIIPIKLQTPPDQRTQQTVSHVIPLPPSTAIRKPTNPPAMNSSYISKFGRTLYHHIKYKNRRKQKYNQFLTKLKRKNRKLRNRIAQFIFPSPNFRRHETNQAKFGGKNSNGKQIEIISMEDKLPVSQPSPRGTKDFCYRYDVNGCSIPFGAPFFFKSLFTKSCDRHDICYHCGIKYGIKRPQCDQMFKNNMWRTCLAKYKEKPEVDRESTSRKYRIISAVEILLKEFDSIFEMEMSSLMLPFGNLIKSVDKFETYSKLIQRKVLKRWVRLLKMFIMEKRMEELGSPSFSSLNKSQSLFSLLEDAN